MEVLKFMTVLSVLLAILAIPPSISLLRAVWDERRLVPKSESKLNKVLTALFLGVGIFALINGGISLLNLLNVTGLHKLAVARTLLVNAFFSFFSWALFIVHRDGKDTKDKK